jgi:hypothetical protein
MGWVVGWDGVEGWIVGVCRHCGFAAGSGIQNGV